MAGGGNRLDEKDENDRGKYGTMRNESEEKVCYNNRNRQNKRKYRKGVEE
jgi:hypothetical protein